MSRNTSAGLENSVSGSVRLSLGGSEADRLGKRHGGPAGPRAGDPVRSEPCLRVREGRVQTGLIGRRRGGAQRIAKRRSGSGENERGLVVPPLGLEDRVVLQRFDDLLA